MKKIRKIILINLIMFSSVIFFHFIVGLIVINSIFSNGKDEYNYQNIGLLTYDDIKAEYQRVEIKYVGNQGYLQGYFYGKNNTDKLVVFSHGIYDYADTLLPQQIYFLNNGYNVFSYDSSGCGKSDGKINGFTQSLIDLKYTLDFLNNDINFKDYKLLLFGFSWGAYACTSVLNFNTKNVYAVASLSGYNDAKNLIYDIGYSKINFLASLGKPVIDFYQKEKFNDFLKYDAISGIINSKIDVYVIHSLYDKTLNYNLSISNKLQKLNNYENVKIYIEKNYDDESINRHLYLQYKNEAIKYQIKIKNDYKKIKTNDEKKAFYHKIDKKLYNELNTDLFDSILDFYNQSFK